MQSGARLHNVEGRMIIKIRKESGYALIPTTVLAIAWRD